jgi:hypothetical protein
VIISDFSVLILYVNYFVILAQLLLVAFRVYFGDFVFVCNLDKLLNWFNFVLCNLGNFLKKASL